VWVVPAGTGLAPGTFLFTTAAELAGLVIAHDRGVAIVPGTTLLTEADRLLKTPPGFGGTIGIGVQALTPPIAAITGAQSGVVVTSVDVDGLPEDQLRAGDVIEAIDGQAVPSRQHWDARVARVSPGETLTLRVRRGGALRDVTVAAAAPETPTDSGQVGLTLSGRASVGAEVVRVVRGSAADRAGLAAGDVITLVADIAAPSPAQVMRALASAPDGQPVIMAVTRGTTHFVTTLAR
jgi:S1-C subfamily serine protease